MGCRCCKMVQSYLFDPVQVPSPGYVNEVNSCKLDEEDTAKLKDKQSSEGLVHKNYLLNEGLKRTESRSRTANPQGDPGGNLCAEKTDGAVNGVGPAATLQPPGNPRPQHGSRGSLAGTSNDVHPPLLLLEGGDARKQDCVLAASEKTQVIQNGDSGAPSKTDSLNVDVQDSISQIPAPDYPQLWDSAVDNGDHEEKDYLFRTLTEGEHQERIFPQVLNTPYKKRSWDSLNEGVATDVLSVYFDEKDAAHSVPVVDTRNGQEDVHGSSADWNREMGDEDAAVAEALAALEAATAGEDIDEGY
ncbi:PREDICTED: uncharacterized protein C4orf19 homolog [Chrysochloris asiatica]|uniref:Uncharacterized protein C4orf19 homolog n=1 Tax=Chrysochloris asiatica TaxID=185453 RepID=A0A9B0U4W9_CHRAS|nr:PREDICTED: uncharacterized protein C4orf19 homolog [Chrysochloris asiatica]